MSKFFPKEKLSWAKNPESGGVDIDKSIIWEGDFGVCSAFFRMPACLNSGLSSTDEGNYHPSQSEVILRMYS